MKIVFFSWLSNSNINASIPLLKKLQNGKNEIYFFGFKKFEKIIRKMEIEYIPYQDRLNLGGDYIEKDEVEINEINSAQESQFKNIDELVEDNFLHYIRTIDMYLSYVEEVESTIKAINPDLIIKDNAAQHGKIIGYRFKIRTIAFSPMMIFDKEYLYQDLKKLYFHYDIEKIKAFKEVELKEAYDELEKVYFKFCKKNNLPYITPIEPNNGEDEISIVYGGYPLNPFINDKKIKFVKSPLEIMGGYEYDYELEKYLKSQKPLIYIASGALITGDNNYYSNFIRALWDKNFNIIMSIPNIQSYNGNLPSNFLIRNFVPQQKILSKASIFITFGGYNSICEAIKNEVPMLVYPQMNDQFINAKRIEELEIGIDISKEVMSKEKIIELINELYSNKKYKKNIKKVNFELNKNKNLSDTLKELNLI